MDAVARRPSPRHRARHPHLDLDLRARQGRRSPGLRVPARPRSRPPRHLPALRRVCLAPRHAPPPPLPDASSLRAGPSQPVAVAFHPRPSQRQRCHHLHRPRPDLPRDLQLRRHRGAGLGAPDGARHSIRAHPDAFQHRAGRLLPVPAAVPRPCVPSGAGKRRLLAACVRSTCSASTRQPPCASFQEVDFFSSQRGLTARAARARDDRRPHRHASTHPRRVTGHR
mmetsp:Transcript_10874/g.26079  ORF Transcript_10874/g.26079 Transcript_10874/m.26079 type:complete len:225 (-) Transcript_10874:649-1323(-)